MPSSEIMKAALWYETNSDLYKEVMVGHEATTGLINAGLVEWGTWNGAKAVFPTEGLSLYLKSLRSVPLPRRVWTTDKVFGT